MNKHHSDRNHYCDPKQGPGALSAKLQLPVVAGLPHAGGSLAAAGKIYEVIHNDPHDGSRPLKLPAHRETTCFQQK